MTSSLPPPSLSAPQRILMTLAGLVGLTLLMYWDTVAEALHLWDKSPTYTYGYLLPLVALYLIYCKRQALLDSPIKPSGLFLWPLLGFSILNLLASLIDISVIKQGSLVLILVSALFYVVGFRAGRWLALPVGFLLFAVPFWDIINGVLQAMTTFAAVNFLSLVNIPIFVQGNTIQLPHGGLIEIAAGCSGLRYFIISMLVAAMYSHLSYQRWSQVLLLSLMAALIAVVFNWLRVIILVLIGHYTRMESSLMHDHELFGWIIFGISLLPLFRVAQLIENRLAPPLNDNPAKATAFALESSQLLRACLWALLIMLAPRGLLLLKQNQAVDVSQFTLPSLGDQWRGPFRGLTLLHPEFPGSDQQAAVSYSRGNDLVHLDIQMYAEQSQGKELINSSNKLFDPSRWHALKRHQQHFTDPALPQTVVEQTLIDARQQRVLVWYWHQLGDHQTSDNLKAKWYEARNFFAGYADASSIILSTKCLDSCEISRGRLESFLKTLYIPLQEELQRIRREPPLHVEPPLHL